MFTRFAHQYGADIVTLIGSGYAGAGSCGIGYLMSSPSTSFASIAFNIVDRTCAAGYSPTRTRSVTTRACSTTRAVPSSTPSHPYAYGYQDPGGAFRTVLSYGGATRVPYFSNPAVLYNGRVTGTSTQDNARALNDNAAIVSAFKTAAGTHACSYTVSPGSFSFSKAADTASVTVTTSLGAHGRSSSGLRGHRSAVAAAGSGTAVVSVTANSAPARSDVGDRGGQDASR